MSLKRSHMFLADAKSYSRTHGAQTSPDSLSSWKCFALKPTNRSLQVAQPISSNRVAEGLPFASITIDVSNEALPNSLRSVSPEVSWRTEWLALFARECPMHFRRTELAACHQIGHVVRQRTVGTIPNSLVAIYGGSADEGTRSHREHTWNQLSDENVSVERRGDDEQMFVDQELRNTMNSRPCQCDACFEVTSVERIFRHSVKRPDLLSQDTQCPGGCRHEGWV